MNVRSINYKDSNNSHEFTRSLRQTGFGVLNNHPIDFNLIYDVYNEWEKFFKPENLISICKKNYLKLNKIDGMTFNPLFDQWKVSSDKSVNYITEFEKV